MSGSGKAGAVCPFCKGSISRDLERYGGNCPHCLLEVPGDDAPTDPGLEQKKKQEEEEAAQKVVEEKKRRNYMRLGMLVLLFLTGLGAFEYQRQIEARTYIPPEYFQMPVEDLNIEDGVAEATPEAPPATGSAPPETVASATPATPKTVDVSLPPEIAPKTVASTNGKPPKTSGKTPKTAEVVASASAPPTPVIPNLGAGGTGGTGTVSAGGGGQVLTDKAAIEAMVTRVSKGYNGAILSCYESATKANPELKGIWTVTFIVTPGGSTRDVKVTGSSTQDAGMEACMKRRVEGWRFQSINSDFKAAKTYRLSPNGW